MAFIARGAPRDYTMILDVPLAFLRRNSGHSFPLRLGSLSAQRTGIGYLLRCERMYATTSRVCSGVRSALAICESFGIVGNVSR
jgi:hypothetical protein